MNDIEQPIIEYISFLVAESGGAAVDRTTLLIESGVLDSISLVRLVQFVEKRFKIDIPDTDIREELFESAATVAVYVSQRMSEAA
ncbi:acyl carrier protein [Nocardia australiensis]|uniref:acyl carrier protein n=1 Tax=Nocardia australiensis TaxID=2887191 RepID=UPI001D14C32E|nr:acyl carrier protein [Nocardia australiensis]